MKFTFYSDDLYCEFEQITFSCDSCALKHVEEALGNKKYKWKKTGEDKYLSSYKWQTELTLDYYDQTFPKSITYRFLDKSKKEYVKLYMGK